MRTNARSFNTLNMNIIYALSKELNGNGVTVDAFLFDFYSEVSKFALPRGGAASTGRGVVCDGKYLPHVFLSSSPDQTRS